MATTKKKEILLPRGYLSHTQKEIWKRSPEQYKRIYFYGERPPQSIYMTYGSEVAEAAEKGQSEDPLIDALNTLLPTYNKVEHKIETYTETKEGRLKLLGRLDTYQTRSHKFRERKTGTRPWTQRKVDNHKQIDFYYLLIYLQNGKIPKEPAYLDWAETKLEETYDDYGNRTGAELSLTGRTETYEAKRELRDVLRELDEARRVALEISSEYRKALLID